MWVKLESIMLSEISQMQKDKYCIIHLYEIPRVGKFIKAKIRLKITKAWRRGNGKLLFNRFKFVFGVMKIFGK